VAASAGNGPIEEKAKAAGQLSEEISPRLCPSAGQPIMAGNVAISWLYFGWR